jgi:hypothetical protein
MSYNQLVADGAVRHAVLAMVSRLLAIQVALI